MRYNDYKRLGLISIKSRKKSTRNTVRGISFGLILLIPIIFFGLAFYVDLTATVNSIQTISSFNITTNHFNNDPDNIIIEDETDYYSSPLLAYYNLDMMLDFEGIEDYIVSESYNLPNLFYNGFNPNKSSQLLYKDKTINLNFEDNNYYDGPRDRNDGLNKKYIRPTIKFIHQNLSSQSYITQAEASDLKKHQNVEELFIAGEGFTGDGKGQVILSEIFLKQFKIEASDIINENIEIKLLANPDYSLFLDNDNIADNDFVEGSFNDIYDTLVTILKDYQVVGIINEKLYNLQSRSYDSHIWFHENSLDSGGDYSPIITKQRREFETWHEDFNIITYPKGIEPTKDAIIQNGNVFLPFGIGASYGDGSGNPYPFSTLNTIVQCKDYYSALAVEQHLNTFYNNVYGDRYFSITNETYSIFSMIYQTGLYLIVILFLFGGTIFFTTLLNLYNSINYSVQSRKNYIGVMRAIGANQSMIPKLYFVEVMLIFMRAFIWILIFSGLFSYGIKALIDLGFDYLAKTLDISLSLNFIYYPITIIIMVIFEFLIALIYSQVACRYVSKKPILEILKDEK